MDTFGAHARKIWENGYSVMPVEGKRPVMPEWQRYCEALATPDVFDKWEKGCPELNIGLCLGPASGIVGIDIDSEDKDLLIAARGLLPSSPLIKVGKKGFTLLVRYDGQSSRKIKLHGQEIGDFLSNGRQTVIPPSVHPETNKKYFWLQNDLTEIWKDELPVFTEQDLHKFEQALEAKFPRVAGQSPTVGKTGRNNKLVALAFSLFEAGHTTEDVGALLLEHDLAHHIAAPLFSDKDDYDDPRPEVNALLMASNVFKSYLTKRVNEKKPVPQVSTAVVMTKSNDLTKATLTNVLPHWAVNAKGKYLRPKATIENLEALLSHIGFVIRYNVISKQEEILIPDKSFSIDNEGSACLAWILSLQSQIGMATSHVKEYLTGISDKNAYNPVVTWIESIPWDKTPRLETFYATIVAKNEEQDPTVLSLKKTLIKRWLISAIAAAFNPRGVSAHGVLVLQGAQYIGKTSWLKRLAPPDLNVIADGRYLKPDDKDSVNQAIRYWIVELGELDATFRKSDIAQLKSFLTRDQDILRRAFAPRDSVFARRTVFFASVNPNQFLHDETGNRRFWTIECDSVKYDHDVDMQQLWAEVFELYKAKESWFLTHQEITLLNDHNEQFTSKDPIEERINQELDWQSSDALWQEHTATNVLLRLGIRNPNQFQIKKASQEIYRLNGGRRRKTSGVMVLRVPVLPIGEAHGG